MTSGSEASCHDRHLSQAQSFAGQPIRRPSRGPSSTRAFTCQIQSQPSHATRHPNDVCKSLSTCIRRCSDCQGSPRFAKTERADQPKRVRVRFQRGFPTWATAQGSQLVAEWRQPSGVENKVRTNRAACSAPLQSAASGYESSWLASRFTNSTRHDFLEAPVNKHDPQASEFECIAQACAS